MKTVSPSHKSAAVLIAFTVAAIYLMSIFAVPLSGSAYSNSPQAVTNPKIVLRPFNSSPGKSVKVTGLAFTASSSVTIMMNTTKVATTSSNATGGFVVSFTVPLGSAAGHYTIKASDTGGKSAMNTLTITSGTSIKVKSTGHANGATVTVSGVNFLASKSITITFRGDVVATATSDNTGGFTAQFTVVNSPAGTFFIVASDGTNSANKPFKVVPKIVVSPNTVSAGQMITITGSGFAANSQVSFYLTGTSFGTTVTTNNNGAFTTIQQIPSGTLAGAYTLTGTDQSSNSAHTRLTVH